MRLNKGFGDEDNPGGLSGWVLKATASVLTREKKRKLAQTHRGGDVKTEAEIGVMQPQAQECWDNHQKL